MPTPTETSRLAEAIVARLGAGLATSEEVFAAFAELDALPPEVVRQAMDPWVGPAPDLERLDDATRRAHGLPPRRLVLTTLSTAQDADLFDLGPIAEAQLRLAGKSWDGLDLAPEERLDGEVEGSFAGTLVRRVIGVDGTPRYDLFTFAEGAGVLFRANTTDVIAFIADGRVETRDRQLREAIEGLLVEDVPTTTRSPEADAATPTEASRPIEVAIEEPTLEAPVVTLDAAIDEEDLEEEQEEEAPTKKRASSKKVAVPKKAASKKTASKKVAAPKKAAAKKAAATPKKVAAPKATVKKVAKKASAKTAAKKTTAKKTAAKKTAAKKTAAKKKTAADD